MVVKIFSINILLASILAASLILAFQLASANSDGLADTPWPMFKHDPQHTGRSPYPGSQTNTTKWKYETGGWVGSSPSIGSDGTIYFGSYDKHLYAIGLTRASSTITCVLSSSSIAHGGSVRISGRISPPVSATVTIQYSTDGEAWINLASVTSGDDGSYSYTWSSIPVGNYFVKASWPGSDDYQGATSPIASLTVSKASPTTTIIVAIIIVAAAIILTLVLKRRPKPPPPP
ncbi:MAG: Ig-like domain repeat protein [Thermoproteota archaeon]